MSTKVIHIKDAPNGWMDDPNFIYIGRYNSHYGLERSFWHNPYKISDLEGLPLTDEQKRFNVIHKFSAYVEYQPNMIYDLPTLRDKTLVCWCKPHACHGDILCKWRNMLVTLAIKEHEIATRVLHQVIINERWQLHPDRS